MENKKQDKGIEEIADLQLVQQVIPGMENLVTPESEPDYFNDGTFDKRFFDAGELLDTPAYQKNASGSTTYVLYLLFPTHEDLIRAIKAFTLGERKSLSKKSRLASINAMAKNDAGSQWLETWENALQLYAKVQGVLMASPDDDIAGDEATAPEGM